MFSQAEDVYTTALKSNDEMFHVALYDWLLCKQMPEKLLSVCYVDFLFYVCVYELTCSKTDTFVMQHDL